MFNLLTNHDWIRFVHGGSITYHQIQLHDKKCWLWTCTMSRTNAFLIKLAQNTNLNAAVRKNVSSEFQKRNYVPASFYFSAFIFFFWTQQKLISFKKKLSRESIQKLKLAHFNIYKIIIIIINFISEDSHQIIKIFCFLVHDIHNTASWTV